MEKIVVNCETLEQTTEQIANDVIEMDIQLSALKAAAAAEAETARQALLDKLGITADEAQLLLGSN